MGEDGTRENEKKKNNELRQLRFYCFLLLTHCGIYVHLHCTERVCAAYYSRIEGCGAACVTGIWDNIEHIQMFVAEK